MPAGSLGLTDGQTDGRQTGRLYRTLLKQGDNKANVSDTKVPFLDLHIYISNGFVSSKIYDKRVDFDIVNFPFSDGDALQLKHC